MYMSMKQTTVMPNALKRLFDRPPPGYRPGVTLEHALQELRGCFRVDGSDASRVTLRIPAGELEILLRECIERHVLMHIVGLEMVLHVPSRSLPGATIEIRNTGMLFRTGIRCSAPVRFAGDLQPFMERIESDRHLREILMKLDFRRCRIDGIEGGWNVLIEPYGASEVVNRMPSFRRYIRMGAGQVKAVAEAFASCYRIVTQVYGC
jgi:hypothetical protein